MSESAYCAILCRMTTVYIEDWSAQGRSDFAGAVRGAVRLLLEAKHLYQSVMVDVPVPDQWRKVVTDTNRSLYAQATRHSSENAWQLAEPQLPGIVSSQKVDRHRVYLAVPTIKIFCDRCHNVEAHNASYALDISAQMATRQGYLHTSPSQHFVAVYTCQACKAMLQHFMIRREGLKLSLAGRSPIEHVAVPSVIPKEQRKYYSGAILAFQSGQTLPALFMLRMFVEQFAASQVSDKSLRADAVLDLYMTSLPEPVRAHFASPREIYSRLSDAIHSAREDDTLFTSSCEQIVEHFDARRLYRVDTA
jgi:hypothetical protein